jgi:cell wall-associated NlpC family hydrolase
VNFDWRPAGLSRGVLLGVVGVGVLALMGLLIAPMLIVGGSSLLFAAGGGCSSGSGGSAGQPAVSSEASNSIPADYLTLFQKVGQQYGVPWVILAGIGKVESDDGRSNLPGVQSGANAFGAAGPMQIGIGGASGNEWGGAPVHPASEQVNGVATDEDGGPDASVYDPADAIAGAAKYLLANGVQNNPSGAVFAYNHSQSYVQLVLSYAAEYARGGYSVAATAADDVPGCIPDVNVAASSGPGTEPPNQAAATAISFAEQQLGKPYLFGGTGPDAFDCSGLVMMAYRAAGIYIPRTSEDQWFWGPQVPASQVEPGDLVFFVGADGTPTAPGHVGMVIGGGMMVEAYATGYPIRIAAYTNRDPIGFTRPWAHAGAQPASSPAS